MKKLLLIMLVCGTALVPQFVLAEAAPEAVSSTQNNQQATLIDYEIIIPEMRFTEFFDDFDGRQIGGHAGNFYFCIGQIGGWRLTTQTST